MAARKTQAQKEADAAAKADAAPEPEQRIAARAEWEAAGATPEEAEQLVDLTPDELADLAGLTPPPTDGGDPDGPPPSADVASPGPNTIPVHIDGELVPATAPSSQPIDLDEQRSMLDALAGALANLAAADIGRAIDEARAEASGTEPSVYLIHPVKGHVVHITLTQAVADGALGWADATLDEIRAAGLTG